MKKDILFLFILFFISCGESKKESQESVQKIVTEEVKKAEPNKKKVLSPHTSVMASIGNTHIHIDYSSPGVRDRIIFGGLLPYDAVWQAGAHNATWIETNTDLKIAEKKLQAGKYGFFVIPNKEQWTVIFNSNWNQHGKDDYEEKDDVLRFTTTPKTSENIQEHLKYSIEKISDSSGIISMAWEKVSIEIPFEIE